MKNRLKIFSLTLKTFVLLGLAFCFGCFVANAAGYPEIAPTAGLVAMGLCFIPNQLQAGTLASITAANIVTEWGTYITSDKGTEKDLIMELRAQAETEALFTRRITDKTILKKASVKFSDVIQQFQVKFTPKNSITFEPNDIKLQRVKIDVSETPDVLVESWLNGITSDDLDRKTWFVVKWFYKEIIKKSKEMIELNEIYKGVPGTVVDGVATGTGVTLLGIRKQINDAHAAGKVRTLSMGAVPTDPILFVKYVEDMAKLAASNNLTLFDELDSFNMNKTLARRFKEGMRLKYNMNYSQAELSNIIDTNIAVKGFNSHAGSNKIWATPAWNREYGIKAPQNADQFGVESTVREVRLFTDYFIGFGFWQDELIYQNDVDLV